MINEYYIDKKENDEYSDKFKSKFSIKWKSDIYSTFINDTYLEDKIITLDNLEEFFNAVFNKKKFHNLDVSYDFFFCAPTSIQLNIQLKIIINENLKSLTRDFVFILNKVETKTWCEYIGEIFFSRCIYP